MTNIFRLATIRENFDPKMTDIVLINNFWIGRLFNFKNHQITITFDLKNDQIDEHLVGTKSLCCERDFMIKAQDENEIKKVSQTWIQIWSRKSSSSDVKIDQKIGHFGVKVFNVSWLDNVKTGNNY